MKIPFLLNVAWNLLSKCKIYKLNKQIKRIRLDQEKRTSFATKSCSFEYFIDIMLKATH